MSVTLIEGAQSQQPLLAAQTGSVCAITVSHDAHPAGLLWSAMLGLIASPARAPTGLTGVTGITNATDTTGTAGGAPVGWLLTSRRQPPVLAVPAMLAAQVDAGLESGRLRILRHDVVRPVPQQLRAMLAEFDYFSMAPGALLVIDCADQWLGRGAQPGRSPLIELLQQWAQRRQVAVMLLFHAPAGRLADRATELLGFARHLSGVARITRAARPASPASTAAVAALSCNLLFWFDRASVLADTELTLLLGGDGMLRVDESLREQTEAQVALDADTVVALRSALAGSGGAPPHWILCDTLEDVLAACASAQAATVILSFERNTLLDALLQAVFSLRRQSGSRLKIIVRELQVRMRYNEEALIGRLGANLIVPMEVGYARFLSMMEMLQSQLFGAVLPGTYEQALSNGLPQEAAGYLPPQVFARTVAESLARSRTLAIDNVLVRLTLGTGLNPIDALRHCTVKRAGDVFSCDRRTVLVFLFACREMDATQTLERIFALPVGELFSSEHRYISNLAASTAIEDFGNRAASGRLPDLSQPLQDIMALRIHGVSREGDGAMPTAPAGVATGWRAPIVARPPRQTPLGLLVEPPR